MSKMWEVDPETRSKLVIIQKTKGNDRCCDCGAPSPQWASPKFGTFICLNCAGIHRGLGVHISFVRSITMDAFKLAEIGRMEHGGNESWKAFFDAHSLNVAEGRTFDESTVAERYDGEVGEEWKARLTAKSEGKEYIPGIRKPETPRSSTPSTNAAKGAEPRRGDHLSAPSRSGSPAKPEPLGSKKEKNEAYFAKLGEENSARPDSLPPSQGGKFSGFGGGMPTSPPASKTGQQGGAVPGFEDFQSDPMGALTKGFGWFTTTVGKNAKTVNDSYLQPTAHTFAQSEFANNARLAATEVSRNLQTGARGATEHFNRFVEGSSENPQRSSTPRLEPEHKDFWDDFSSIGEERRAAAGSGAGRGGGGGGGGGGSGAIGTTALKRESSVSSSVSAAKPSGATASSRSKTKPKSSDDSGGWNDDW